MVSSNLLFSNFSAYNRNVSCQNYKLPWMYIYIYKFFFNMSLYLYIYIYIKFLYISLYILKYI